MPTQANKVLVLGAYGLAGRAIVARLGAKTGLPIIAAGRDPRKLDALYAGARSRRLQTRVLDVSDSSSLRAACEDVAVVVNAVGPFAKSGADVARVVIEAGRPYVDCANEQVHYQRLRKIDALAKEKGLPIITAAGAIPGLSTLLAAELVAEAPGAHTVECCWAQGRHAYAETGLASMMGGLLEMLHGTVAWRDGAPQPVRLGESQREIPLAPPFGMRPVVELPTIDDLVLPARFTLRESHTWFYFGDLPLWMLTVVRWLQPHRRPWAYALVESIMRRVNDSETAKAVAEGIGPESLLQLTVHGAEATRTRHVLFTDGAAATAILPAHLAERIVAGEMHHTGLCTPLDVVEHTLSRWSSDDAVIGSS